MSRGSWKRIAAVSCLWAGVFSVILVERRVLPLNSVAFWSTVTLALLALCFITTRRSTYLPFLSETILPGSLLEKHGKARTDGISVTVAVDPDADKVIYWASNEAGGKNPQEAYGTFENSGSVPVEHGQAKITVSCPGRYYVKGRLLKNHVHYRESYANGVLGPVKKADVLCG